MTSVLVVTGSIRPNSVNEKVVPEVVRIVQAEGAQVVMADLGELAMPFFDAPVPPSTPGFEAEHDSVKQWTKLVDEADGVVFVTPEYNHTMGPLQMNAIDWIGKEWAQKPVALVGYGWTSGASQAHETAREALAVNLNAVVGDAQANLFLGKELGPDGSVVEAEVVNKKITAAVRELIDTIAA